MGEMLVVFGGFFVLYGAYDCFLGDDGLKESIKKIGAGVVVVAVGLAMKHFGV